MHPTGLITVRLHVPPEREEEFNAWYELEHLREVVDLEGFVSGRRFCCDGAVPKYVALYETEDETVEGQPAFQRLAANPTPWSGRIRTFYGENRIRHNFRRLADSGENGEPAAALMREVTLPAAVGAEIFEREARAAVRLPGCLRYRAFQQPGDERRHLEVLDFASPGEAASADVAAFLARSERRDLNDGAVVDRQHVFTAIGTPCVK